MKKLLLLIFIIFSSNLINAQQTFSHAIGATGFLGTRNANLHAVGITYSPRLNLFKTGESSIISVGTNLGIGYNLKNNFADKNPITFHIPISIDFNFGLASTEDSFTKNKSGGFFGIGYSFEQAGLSLDENNIEEDTFVKETINGPIVNLGYRFKIASQAFGIRASYLYGTGDFEGGYLTSLTLQYIFN